MKEILKDHEVFEIAKKNVIRDLEKEYDEVIEAINTKEIESDAMFIKYRIGIMPENEYDAIKNEYGERKILLQQKSKQILRSIKAAKEIIY